MMSFSHNVYDNIRTRVIVVHEGKLLMLSPHEPGAGWQVPGGGLEKNESLADCARREVFEETGLTIEVRNIAFLREWVIPKYCPVPNSEGVGYTMEVYLYAALVGNETEPRQEAGNTQTPHWIALEDVPRMAVWPKELKTLAMLLTNGQNPQGVPSFVSQLESPEAPAPNVRFG